jgi:hypothetical protein
MTFEEYLALVPNFHAHQPKFMNTLAALLKPMTDAMDMLAKLTADFDLDTAIGVQLDMVGQWIGRDRYIDAPITGVYFAFNTVDVGINQGVWQGKYDPIYGQRRLDDETYRMVLKLQAVANHWDGTIPSIAADFDRVFPGAVIDDKGDTPTGLMTMDVIVPATHLSALLEAVLVQDFMIKPSGVWINILESTVINEPVFSFNVALVPGGAMGGFNEGAWAEIIYSG